VRPRIGHLDFFKKRVVVFDSVTAVAVTSALDGLSARQRAIANNVANVNTPNYHAKRVAFEDALVRSVEAGDGHVVATTSRSLEPTRLDGNNVNLDTETLSNIDTVLRYQFAARAADDLASRMRTAMRTN
jgi:flagellar basal-body rod protein FlgB